MSDTQTAAAEPARETFDPKAIERFEREVDKSLPEAERPVYLLRHLTVFDAGALADEFRETGTVDAPHSFAIAQVRRALVGWENRKHPCVLGRDGLVTRDSFDTLGAPAIFDLWRRVQARERLATEHRGN